MELPQLISWAFQALVTGIMFYGVKKIDGLTDGVDALNIKIAVVIEKLSNHEDRLKQLETEEKTWNLYRNT